MPEYITYNTQYKKFYSTSKRPNTQNSPAVLTKIGNRLSAYEADPDLQLTDLQTVFLQHVKDPKNAGKAWLKSCGIDVAHHVSISSIINFLVSVLNNPQSLNVDDAVNFSDAILSTESDDDDKGRGLLKTFFEAVKLLPKIQDPDEIISTRKRLCAIANIIAEKLGCATRNLLPGHSSVNRSIKESLDLHFLRKKPAHNTRNAPVVYVPTSKSTPISTFFKKLVPSYEPKTEIIAGKEAVLSSSVSPKKQNAYAVKKPGGTYSPA